MLYPFLAVVFIVTGGKPYYIAGMYPFLLAAGAQPFVDFFSDRRWVPVAAVALSLPAVLVVLPLVPVDRVGDTPIVAVNYDAGETIGWPTYTSQITAAAADMEGGAPDAILTSNYGEAGALERYGTPDLPPVYSGQDGFWYWGPPPDSATRVLAVGFTDSKMRTWCVDPRRVGSARKRPRDRQRRTRRPDLVLHQPHRLVAHPLAFDAAHLIGSTRGRRPAGRAHCRSVRSSPIPCWAAFLLPARHGPTRSRRPGPPWLH